MNNPIKLRRGRVYLSRLTYEELSPSYKPLERYVKTILANQFPGALTISEYYDVDRDSYNYTIRGDYNLPLVAEGEIIPIIGEIKCINGLMTYVPAD